MNKFKPIYLVFAPVALLAVLGFFAVNRNPDDGLRTPTLVQTSGVSEQPSHSAFFSETPEVYNTATPTPTGTLTLTPTNTPTSTPTTTPRPVNTEDKEKDGPGSGDWDQDDDDGGY